MDTFARGLRNAVKIIEEGVITKALNVCKHSDNNMLVVFK